MISALAYTPLYDALPIHDHWLWLILPLTIAIATVYKTLRLDDLKKLPLEILRLSAVILVSMVLIGLGLYALTEIL